MVFAQAICITSPNAAHSAIPVWTCFAPGSWSRRPKSTVGKVHSAHFELSFNRRVIQRSDMNFNCPNWQERIAGGLIGMLVGDALGVPYEFKPANEIPEAGQIELRPPSGFVRSHPTVEPGTWSDDVQY